MKLNVVCNALQDRDRWLEERRKGITGTVAPQLLGVHRFGSLLETYLRLRGAGDAPVDDPTPDMLWGRHRQSAIISYLQDQTGYEITESEDLIQSESNPHFMATIDGLARHPKHGLIPVEVKGSRSVDMKEAWEDGTPQDVIAQAQWACMVSDATAVLTAVTLFGAPPIYEVIQRDNDLIQKLYSLGCDFWKRVEDGDPPDPDGTPSASQALDRMRGDIDAGKQVELGIDAVLLEDEIKDLAAQAKELGKRKKELEQKRRVMIGNAAIAILPGAAGVWTQKTVKRAAYSVEATEYTDVRWKKK